MTSRPADDALARHPIAVVAERTGLTQDVLRVWERRYGAVQPGRGAGGQRRYTDADVARLRLLHAATRGGRTIGQVARLSSEALAALLDEDAAAQRARPVAAARATDDATVVDPLVDSALALARALDGVRLDRVLRGAAARMGVTPFFEAVAAPLLRRIGDEWHAGRLAPAQEHLVSSVLQSIAAEALRTFAPASEAPRILVTTPAGDRHALGAALVGAAAAIEGWQVLYLGADLPATEIASAARLSGARLVALSIVYLADGQRERVLDELRAVRAALSGDVPLLAGGAGARALAAELGAIGVRVESSLPALVAQLRREREAA